MSQRKVTPRTLVSDFLHSDAPEQSAQRPSRRRIHRNMSGPGGTVANKKPPRHLEKERKSMHLSLIDEKTPRTMVSGS